MHAQQKKTERKGSEESLPVKDSLSVRLAEMYLSKQKGILDAAMRLNPLAYAFAINGSDHDIPEKIRAQFMSHVMPQVDFIKKINERASRASNRVAREQNIANTGPNAVRINTIDSARCLQDTIARLKYYASEEGAVDRSHFLRNNLVVYGMVPDSLLVQILKPMYPKYGEPLSREQINKSIMQIRHGLSGINDHNDIVVPNMTGNYSNDPVFVMLGGLSGVIRDHLYADGFTSSLDKKKEEHNMVFDTLVRGIGILREQIMHRGISPNIDEYFNPEGNYVNLAAMTREAYLSLLDGTHPLLKRTEELLGGKIKEYMKIDGAETLLDEQRVYERPAQSSDKPPEGYLSSVTSAKEAWKVLDVGYPVK